MPSRLPIHAAILVAFAAINNELHAQRRVTFSPGFALGMAVSHGNRQLPSGPQWTRGRHALLTLDVEASRVPVRLRAEAMVATGLHHSHGPFSLGASLIMPFGETRLRPYALAGVGVYGVGGVRHPSGVTAGAGAEYRGRGSALFVEGRLQSQTPNAVSIGIRF